MEAILLFIHKFFSDLGKQQLIKEVFEILPHKSRALVMKEFGRSKTKAFQKPL